MPIEDAPMRVRREHYRRERRNNRIAVAVVVSVVGLIAWGLFRLLR